MGESGFLIPSGYANSPNPDDVQLLHLANAASDEIREIGLTGARKFASVALDGSGSYSLPSDFHAYIPDTAWIGSRKVDVPVTPQEWAQLLANGLGLYEQRARFIDAVKMLGEVSGETLTYEYVSAFPWQSDAMLAKELATADTDVWLLDRRLLVAGVKWRWKKEKGVEDWSTDMQIAQRYLNTLRGRDGGSKTLIVGEPYFVQPEPYANLWIS